MKAHIVTKEKSGKNYYALYERVGGRSVYRCALPRKKFKRRPSLKAAIKHYQQLAPAFLVDEYLNELRREVNMLALYKLAKNDRKATQRRLARIALPLEQKARLEREAKAIKNPGHV
jgi:hypothetical protein